MTFDEFDELPRRQLLELSAKDIGPYATELRSRYRSTMNEFKHVREKLERTEKALGKARDACKRMKQEIIYEKNTVCSEMKVIIDGIEYVPAPLQLDDEVNKLLRDIYSDFQNDIKYLR